MNDENHPPQNDYDSEIDEEEEYMYHSHLLKHNSFTKEDRAVFTRALKDLLTPDIAAVAAECGLKMGLSCHIPHLKVISTMKWKSGNEDPIDDYTIFKVISLLKGRLHLRREEYFALLGERTSDFSKLATLRLCCNFTREPTINWQMEDINVNKDLLQRRY